MSDHPILFNAEMVRAILARTKTQTRRPIRKRKGFGAITELRRSDTHGYDWTFRDSRQLWNEITHDEMLAASPFGVPGDRLWIREAWGITAAENSEQFAANEVLQGEWQLLRRDIKLAYHYCEAGDHPGMCWRPSIHMPQEASRITLLVKRVWIEQVQDITVEGAMAEGLGSIPLPLAALSHRTAFAGLWDSIYAAKGLGWSDNPWVFAAEFSLIENKKARDE